MECFVCTILHATSHAVFQEAYPGIQPEVKESAFNRVV